MVPVLAGAASCEKLFDLFLDLLEPLGRTVDVVLATHDAGGVTALDIELATAMNAIARQFGLA